jgi:dGTP triphosphohydrolase
MTPNIFKGQVHKMDKIAVKTELKKTVKLDFNDNIIIINPYISMETKIILMNNYISMLFEPGKDLVSNYVGSEYALMLGIMDLNTNVLISEESVNIDSLIGSGLWDLVVNKIENYYDLKSDLENICKELREKVIAERSFSTSFDKLSNTIIGFIQKISEVDLSQSGIQDLVEKMKTSVDEYKSITSPEIIKKPRKKAIAKE